MFYTIYIEPATHFKFYLKFWIMKKVFYSIGLVSVMLFSACTEDRGTTYEVADANQDENVNPNHIRGYGDQATADVGQAGHMEWQENSERFASQMGTDLQLDTETQTRVQQVLLDREQRLGELEDRYSYTETNRMGGQANNDTRNDTSNNPSNNMDSERKNNAGNVYTGESNVAGDGYNTKQESDMTAERKRIISETDKELQAILTPEQFKEYQKNSKKYMGSTGDTGTNMNSSGSGNMNNSGNSGNMNDKAGSNSGNMNNNKLNNNAGNSNTGNQGSNTNSSGN
jgi:hypothetical protein